MIRLFNIYYPSRTLVLLVGEALVVWCSFLLATVLRFQADSYLVLNFEYGYIKIFAVTALVLLCSHWCDLYDPPRLGTREEIYFRLLLVLSLLSFLLAALDYEFPRFTLGKGALLLGLVILTLSLLGWRTAYTWLLQQQYLRENVYVLGAGDRAERLINALNTRGDLGVRLVGWSGNGGPLTSEALASRLTEAVEQDRIDRVIVAMPDRRGTVPVDDLLQLRLKGTKIEDSTSWLEKISGQIELEGLHPSWLIFSGGFRISSRLMVMRRIISIIVALICLVVLLPIIPLVALAIKLSSPGPVLYRQKRVGRKGVVFHCYKFRSMRADAEADTGPTWASDDDPRITPFGRFLRSSRLDEIPQLWNVLMGDMGFVGPRPERPEFVERLTAQIPYYPVRHVIRPGITGWAQINYKYGNTVEDAKKKLQYDLFYMKNISLSLDLLIMFQTVKTVLLGRGAK